MGLAPNKMAHPRHVWGIWQREEKGGWEEATKMVVAYQIFYGRFLYQSYAFPILLGKVPICHKRRFSSTLRRALKEFVSDWYTSSKCAIVILLYIYLRTRLLKFLLAHISFHESEQSAKDFNVSLATDS